MSEEIKLADFNLEELKDVIPCILSGDKIKAIFMLKKKIGDKLSSSEIIIKTAEIICGISELVKTNIDAMKEFLPEQNCFRCVGICGCKKDKVSGNIMESGGIVIGSRCKNFLCKETFGSSKMFQIDFRRAFRSCTKNYKFNIHEKITEIEIRTIVGTKTKKKKIVKLIIDPARVLKFIAKRIEESKYDIMQFKKETDSLYIDKILPEEKESYKDYQSRCFEKKRQRKIALNKEIRSLTRLEACNKVIEKMKSKTLDVILRTRYSGNVLGMWTEMFSTKDPWQELTKLTEKER